MADTRARLHQQKPRVSTSQDFILLPASKASEKDENHLLKRRYSDSYIVVAPGRTLSTPPQPLIITSPGQNNLVDANKSEEGLLSIASPTASAGSGSSIDSQSHSARLSNSTYSPLIGSESSSSNTLMGVAPLSPLPSQAVAASGSSRTQSPSKLNSYLLLSPESLFSHSPVLPTPHEGMNPGMAQMPIHEVIEDKIEVITLQSQELIFRDIKQKKVNKFLVPDKDIDEVLREAITHVWEELIVIMSWSISAHPVAMYYAKGPNKSLIKAGKNMLVACMEAGVNNFKPQNFALLEKYGQQYEELKVGHLTDLSDDKRKFDYNRATIIIPICPTAKKGTYPEGKSLQNLLEYFAMNKKCQVIIYLPRDGGRIENITLRDIWLTDNKDIIDNFNKTKGVAHKVKILLHSELIKRVEHSQAQQLFVHYMRHLEVVIDALKEDVIRRLELKKFLAEEKKPPKSPPRVTGADKKAFDEEAKMSPKMSPALYVPAVPSNILDRIESKDPSTQEGRRALDAYRYLLFQPDDERPIANPHPQNISSHTLTLPVSTSSISNSGLGLFASTSDDRKEHMDVKVVTSSFNSGKLASTRFANSKPLSEKPAYQKALFSSLRQ